MYLFRLCILILEIEAKEETNGAVFSRQTQVNLMGFTQWVRACLFWHVEISAADNQLIQNRSIARNKKKINMQLFIWVIYLTVIKVILGQIELINVVIV